MNVPLTLVAGVGRLVGRPYGVAHVYVGPMTPSGRLVPRAGRTVCRTRTRRLHLLELDGTALDPVGRRMCVRCSARLERAATRAEQSLRSRDQFLTAYGHLKACHLAYAATLCTTVDQTHRVGFVAQLVLGPGNRRGDAEQRATFQLHLDIADRRRRITAATRSPEEIESARLAREVQAHNDALAIRARHDQARIDRAVERRARGQYLMPAERQLLGMTG